MIILTERGISFEDFIKITIKKEKVKLSEELKNKIDKARKLVDELDKGEKPIYGINTGFGFLARKKINKTQIEDLQVNLIRSHCTAVGEPYEERVVRGIMLLRALVMSKGYSGIRSEVVEFLLELLNRNIIPVIPSQGSVGASGDLAPLAHLAITLLGEGKVFYKGEIRDTIEVFNQENLKPVRLHSKEGLVLINGTQVMTSNGLIQLYRAKNILKAADIIMAMSLDALKGTLKAFDEKISLIRPHKGQITTSANIRKLLNGSEILKSHEDCNKVQDAYSLRCVPQVHGAIKDVVDYVERTLVVEMNSVTDNPLVFPNEGEIISGGNFHGEPIAFAMDFLGIALSEIASISERRIEQMVNPNSNDNLPAFLIKDEGVNSGFMIAHVTAASLTSENKVYAHPSSVDSIPTSANKEDHVSMGTIGSNKAKKIIDNVEKVIAIEYLTASQALDLRKPLKSSESIEKAKEILRREVPFLEKDGYLKPYIDKAVDIVSSGKLVEEIEKITEISC
jgi:histidine ammonia-lyase